MRTLTLVVLLVLGIWVIAHPKPVYSQEMPLGSSCLPKEETENLALYVVRQELSRLGLPEDTNLANIKSFVKMVRQAESAGDRFATSSSGAMSFYQFKPDSVETAVNRLHNWQHRHHLAEKVPDWAAEVAQDPQKFYKICESQQALLFMVNIVEQENTDGLLYRLIIGDTAAAKPLYYKYHHTNPDSPTVALIDRLFPRYFGG